MASGAGAATTRPLRIAHLADTHLGYRALGRVDPASGRNQRAIDIERAFEAAIADILTREVDLVLHAGDVFHHTRPSWSTLRCFVRQMRRLADAKIPALVIGGNHDTPRLRTTGSVFGLLELALPEVRFIAGYEEREVVFGELGLCVHAVPHGALTNPNPPLVFADPTRRNILVTHGLAPGVNLRGSWQHEPGEERLGGNLLDPALDYIALGHFHLGGDQGRNVWYAGSTERMGWGDEPVEPGYLIVTLGAPGDAPAIERIRLATRPMKTLHPLDGSERDARELADLILDRLQALADPTAMIRIELKQTARPVRREVETILKRETGDHVWSIQVYAPADLLDRFQGDAEQTLTDLRTLFTRFVDEQETAQGYDASFAAAFRQRGGQALDDALRAAEEAAAPEEPAA